MVVKEICIEKIQKKCTRKTFLVPFKVTEKFSSFYFPLYSIGSTSF